jgi:hypothetical protein
MATLGKRLMGLLSELLLTLR